MGHKILIVDDEPAMNLIMKNRLEKEQFQVVTATDGAEALAKFKAEKPDLVITDVMMPGLSGYEFFDLLRKTGKEGAVVPVIVTSARGSMEQFFDKWAIAAFIPKPFDAPFLIQEIRRILSSHRSTPLVGKIETVQKKMGQRTVLLVGVSEFEMRKVKDFLEQNLCTVVPGLDEEDAFETARKIAPDFIFIEFWEEATKFDAVRLHQALATDSLTRQIPYAVFCRSALQNDARKNFNTKHLLVFKDAVELVHSIESFMQNPEFKKRSY